MSATEKVKNPYSNDYRSGAGSISGTGSIPVIGSGLFGQWTKEDEALFNLQMANAKFQADLSLLDYQNEYNRPSSQVQRMREAGLNPDLLGASQGGLSASGQSAPSMSAPSGVSNIDSIGSIFSVFSTAMSVANGLMSFKSAQESLDSQILDNVNKVDGFAISYLVDNLVPDSFSDDSHLLENTRHDLISSARSWSRRKYGFSNRQARRFEDSVIRKIDSPDFLNQFYDTINKSEDARQDYLFKTSGDLYSQADSVMRVLIDEVVRERNRYERSLNVAGFNKNKFDSDYYSSLNPRSFAERSNIENTYESANIRRDFYGSSFNYYTNQRLYRMYKSGNTFAGIVLALCKDIRGSNNFSVGSLVNLIK